MTGVEFILAFTDMVIVEPFFSTSHVVVFSMFSLVSISQVAESSKSEVKLLEFLFSTKSKSTFAECLFEARGVSQPSSLGCFRSTVTVSVSLQLVVSWHFHLTAVLLLLEDTAVGQFSEL